jgi:hypothetical protein
MSVYVCFAEIIHPQIEQTEYPNGLTPQLTVSDWQTLFQRMPDGAKLCEYLSGGKVKRASNESGGFRFNVREGSELFFKVYGVERNALKY